MFCVYVILKDTGVACVCVHFNGEIVGILLFLKNIYKKKEQIQHEVKILIYSHWLPSFRSASDEIFQAVLPLDLRKIVESFLFNVEIRIYPLYPKTRLKTKIRVSVETHLDLDKAMNFARYVDRSAYPVLNKACYWSAAFRYPVFHHI